MSCRCNKSDSSDTESSYPFLGTEYKYVLDSCSTGFRSRDEVPPIIGVVNHAKLFKQGMCRPLSRPEINQPRPCVVHPACWYWSVEDVCRWLDSIGYGRYCHFASESGLDGQKLSSMGVHDLRRSGINKFDDCIQIGAAIEMLIGGDRSSDATTRCF